LQPRGARLSDLSFFHQPFSFNKPLAIRLQARFLGRLACREE
jgi:hypothetical protein